MKRIFPAVKLRPQTPPIDKREIGDAVILGERRIHTSPSAPVPLTRAISQWERSLEWRHAVTLYILVGKICITLFPFSCELFQWCPKNDFKKHIYVYVPYIQYILPISSNTCNIFRMKHSPFLMKMRKVSFHVSMQEGNRRAHRSDALW